jgi:outer membrane protein TolC
VITWHARPTRWLLVSAALAAASPARAGPLSVDDAIGTAWAQHPGLRAAREQSRAARAEADGAGHGWLPTVAVEAKAVRTDEPLMVFGIKLDQGVVQQSDFDPARLNHPDAQTALGAGVSLMQPIYAGGRISAGKRALGAAADAEDASYQARRQELALGVVQAYFGAQAAEEGLRYAEDQLAQAQETERFAHARNAQGLILDADVARAAAYRAQAEADRAAARQRVASARSALVLLAGDEARDAVLTTALDAPEPAAPARGDPSARPSLRAVRLQRDAAEAGVDVARGSLLPSVGFRAAVETLRTKDLSEGNTWYALGLVARWELGLPSADRKRAAQARAAAAGEALAWEERQAQREADEARRAVETAAARAASAREAVAASESALALRRARHEQGLLPLTDVLDAQTALAGARALAVASRLELRTSRARLALALAQPVEGVSP